MASIWFGRMFLDNLMMPYFGVHVVGFNASTQNAVWVFYRVILYIDRYWSDYYSQKVQHKKLKSIIKTIFIFKLLF